EPSAAASTTSASATRAAGRSPNSAATAAPWPARSSDARKRGGNAMLDLAPNKSDLDPIEIASRDEITALQLARLKQTLCYAYDNVPRTRAKWDAAGVTPDDCRALSDLAKFPFTTKDDLREAYPFGLVAGPHDKVARVHASSGTTGKPTVVAYTRADVDMWSEVMARSIRAAGGRPGMKVHVAYGYGLFTGGLGAHYGAEKLGCAVIPVSGGMTERQVQLIHDFKPEIVMVTPSYMLAILDEFRKESVDPRDCSRSSACSAQSRGRTRCATKSNRASICMRSTSTAS